MAETIRILVVDDEKGIREGCRRILAAEGYHVDVAENGKIGLESVQSGSYDLMLVDLMMPVMGGIALMQHVREFNPEIIMVVVTGFATIENAVEAIKHGAYDYVPKPFTPDQLLAIVNRGLEKRRLTLKAKLLAEERDEKLLEVANEKSRIHTIINSMADGVLVINRERQLVLWNPAAAKMLGLGSVGQKSGALDEMIPQKQLVRVIAEAFEPDSSRYTTISEEIDLTSGAEPVTVMVNVSAIRDEGGQELGLVSTLRDISRLKEVEQVKSQFVLMVTHELRAPLSAVEGYLSAFLSGAVGDDPKVNRQMMERAKQRTHGLLELVDDLLTFSRLDSKRMERKKELLDITGIITGTVELLRNQGQSKELVFEVDVAEDLPLVEADRREMEQLFTNLVSNAIKYNRKRGRVSVKAWGDGDTLEIRVSDTGIGISDEHIPCIFDEFYRVCGPETRYTVGTGLGLAIVKKIVESHFGRIDVESELEKGTTFAVRFPVKQSVQRVSGI